MGCCGERGLLSVAFQAGFAAHGRLFAHYTDRSVETRLVELARLPGGDRADPASERLLLSMAQPYSNHNGGQLAFGPEGYLYVGLGDGGPGRPGVW